MKLGLLALGVSLTLLAVPATAEPTARREAVRYGDLDLTTEAGQAVLTRRIDAAVRSVCGAFEPRIGSLLPAPGTRECYAHARVTAQTRMAELIATKRPAG